MADDRTVTQTDDGLTAHAARNRAIWDGYSDEYQAKHGDQLAVSGGLAWGTTQVPEADIHVLGDVAGRDILELGAAPRSGRSGSRSWVPGRSGWTCRSGS